jgi:hypothetical protein
MRRLCEIDREIIRRAPEGSTYILAQRFGVSVYYIEKIRRGSRGLPLPNGLGARPHLLRSKAALEKWHARALAQVERQYQQAVECIERDEAIVLANANTAGPEGIFAGIWPKPVHAPEKKAEPQDEWLIYERQYGR